MNAIEEKHWFLSYIESACFSFLLLYFVLHKNNMLKLQKGEFIVCHLFATGMVEINA